MEFSWKMDFSWKKPRNRKTKETDAISFSVDAYLESFDVWNALEDKEGLVF